MALARAALSPPRAARAAARGGRRRAVPRAPRATKGETDAADAADDADETEVAEAQTDEAAGFKKREEESAAAGLTGGVRPPRGGDPPPPGRWQWTLNWDPVVAADAADAAVLVGSCPRSAADVSRLAREAGVGAVLSLQSDLCLEALDIDWEDEVRPAGAEEGILMHRVGVRDFDRLDQAAMLPVMVRALNALVRASDKPVYVHCTAGINRANLCVLGYLTYARGMELDDALALVREGRPQANPYVLPWEQARARLLAGREQEVFIKAEMADSTKEDGGDWVKRDWGAAEAAVLMETFERQAESDRWLMQAAVDAAAGTKGAKSAKVAKGSKGPKGTKGSKGKKGSKGRKGSKGT